MEAERNDLIKVNDKDGYYKEHGLKDEMCKVIKSTNYGVFVDGYEYLILHSDYEIVK